MVHAMQLRDALVVAAVLCACGASARAQTHPEVYASFGSVYGPEAGSTPCVETLSESTGGSLAVTAADMAGVTHFACGSSVECGGYSSAPRCDESGPLCEASCEATLAAAEASVRSVQVGSVYLGRDDVLPAHNSAEGDVKVADGVRFETKRPDAMMLVGAVQEKPGTGKGSMDIKGGEVAGFATAVGYCFGSDACDATGELKTGALSGGSETSVGHLENALGTAKGTLMSMGGLTGLGELSAGVARRYDGSSSATGSATASASVVVNEDVGTTKLVAAGVVNKALPQTAQCVHKTKGSATVFVGGSLSAKNVMCGAVERCQARGLALCAGEGSDPVCEASCSMTVTGNAQLDGYMAVGYNYIQYPEAGAAATRTTTSGTLRVNGANGVRSTTPGAVYVGVAMQQATTARGELSVPNGGVSGVSEVQVGTCYIADACDVEGTLLSGGAVTGAGTGNFRVGTLEEGGSGRAVGAATVTGDISGFPYVFVGTGGSGAEGVLEVMQGSVSATTMVGLGGTIILHDGALSAPGMEFGAGASIIARVPADEDEPVLVAHATEWSSGEISVGVITDGGSTHEMGVVALYTDTEMSEEVEGVTVKVKVQGYQLSVTRGSSSSSGGPPSGGTSGGSSGEPTGNPTGPSGPDSGANNASPTSTPTTPAPTLNPACIGADEVAALRADASVLRAQRQDLVAQLAANVAEYEQIRSIVETGTPTPEQEKTYYDFKALERDVNAVIAAHLEAELRAEQAEVLCGIEPGSGSGIGASGPDGGESTAGNKEDVPSTASTKSSSGAALFVATAAAAATVRVVSL